MNDINTLPDEIKKLTFLVAESNPALLKMIVATLKGAGISKILSAGNGVEAWHLWRKNKHTHVFICAKTMEEMDGMDILSRVRTDKEAPPLPAFILTSSENTPQMMTQALDQEADVFLPKPFSGEVLLGKVAEAVECRKQISGRNVFAGPETAETVVAAHFQVVLLFEHTTQQALCEEFSAKKCIIRSQTNFGVGTALMLQFPNPKGGNPYHPVKGVVMKEERVSGEIGTFRLHLVFQSGLKENTSGGPARGLSNSTRS